ncbi:hypothetical protein Pla86_13860 [Planctomycetes bacterium Pla86]|uniref:Uncharacterized protein n=2 Tax=Engelhardtia mirabilis TaxID=2528011 RepID=A0A518BH59_9BACT|nr:hypothetical protein Pla133_13870 [Planctomycetes bacterium Pla133]QDV00644.1 hypothetical protein Pla86_13860 [Planctomycetes bacterium Pla86]
MLSMSLATLGWACWWLDLLLARTVPDFVPNYALVSSVASFFAVAGLVLAFLSIRGRSRLWLGMAAVPLFANASLLSMPWLMQGHG